MKSTINGPYPRIGSEIGDELRKETNKLLRGERISGLVEKVEELKEDLSKEVIQKMISCGIDYPNHGFIDVYDELTWPLDSVNGISFGGMKKIFHTNQHYREPIVTGEISKKKGKDIINSFYLNAFFAYQVKLELPGPYTLAKHSVLDENAPYKNVKELALAFANLYNEEIKKFLDSSYTNLIQFNEPSLIAYRRDSDDKEIIPEIYEKMLSSLPFSETHAEKPKTAIWTFYGKYNDDSLDLLFSLPVDIVGLDFVWHPELFELLKNKKIDKGIGFGIFDCGDRGSIILEDVEKIAGKIRNFGDYVPLEKSLLSCNATLEHLPRNYANTKIKLIGQTAEELK